MSSEIKPVSSNEKSVSESIAGYFTPALKPLAAITSSIASGALYVVGNLVSAKNLITDVVSHVPTSIRENAKEDNGKATANKNEQSIQLKTNEATAEHKAREEAENVLKEEAPTSSVVKAEAVITQASHLTIIGNEILPIRPLEQELIIRTGEIARKELEERHGSSMSSSLRNFNKLWQINSSTQQSAIEAGELAKKQLEERQRNVEFDRKVEYENTIQKVIIFFSMMIIAVMAIFFSSPTPDELMNISSTLSNLSTTLFPLQ